MKNKVLKIKSKILKLLPVVMILVFSFYILVSARADTLDNKNSFYYIFHLYYNNGQLSTDRDFQFKYDVIPGEYVADPVTTQFPYRGDVINLLGEVADHFIFDPKQGDTKFTKGKVSVKAPYVADGQKVVFYDNQNQAILTIPVSESSFCNDDGICNADRGEDSLSCPKDCKQALPAPPTTTPTATPTNSSGLLAGILYTLAGLVLAGLGWWFFKKHSNSNNMTLPPTPPPPPSQGNIQ